MSGIDTSSIKSFATQFEKNQESGKGGTLTLKLLDGTEHKIELESATTRPVYPRIFAAMRRIFDSSSYHYIRIGTKELVVAKQTLKEKIEAHTESTAIENDLKCATTFKKAFSEKTLKSVLKESGNVPIATKFIRKAFEKELPNILETTHKLQAGELATITLDGHDFEILKRDKGNVDITITSNTPFAQGAYKEALRISSLTNNKREVLAQPLSTTSEIEQKATEKQIIKGVQIAQDLKKH